MLRGDTGKGILDQIRETTGAMREDFERDGNLRGVYLLKAFEKSIVDQETGQRGFLITGKENFLEPYIAGKKELGRVLTELRALVANAHDRAGTVDDVEELRRLQVRWMTDAAKPEIAMRRTILT
ncbi:MAG: CHASE3 domain-containing protein, partial [Actinomycetota bacterium]|nr:CHASE3 domain-containing protein [Actinomycetota bacterium]